MARYVVRRIVWEPIDVDPGDLVTVADAARALDMSLTGVISAMDRGELVPVIDQEAERRRQNRRFVLRSSLEEAVKARGLAKG